MPPTASRAGAGLSGFGCRGSGFGERGQPYVRRHVGGLNRRLAGPVEIASMLMSTHDRPDGTTPLMIAPVAVFAYSRLAELQRTMEMLRQCQGISDAPVYLFIDGPKGDSDAPRVGAVRQFAQRLGWSNLQIHAAEANRGLRRSIMAGVTYVVEKHGEAIVIEDDLLLAPIALQYFRAGLDGFSRDERVKAVCGYMYRTPPSSDDRAFFLPMASSWGWATWRRAWVPFVAREAELVERAADPAFLRKFDRQGILAASYMLKAQRTGLIDSWAILWNAYLAETDGLALFPAETMVLNGGFAGVGATHASSRNPINRLLISMNRDRRLADRYTLPDRVEPNEVMRRRVVSTWESWLHRLSVRLGYQRRSLSRLTRRK